MIQLYLSSATVSYAKLLIFDSVDTTTEKFGNEKMIFLIPIYPHHISTSLGKWPEKEKLDLPLCFILDFLSKVCINCYETPFHYCIFHQQNKCLHLYMCLCKIYSLPLFLKALPMDSLCSYFIVAEHLLRGSQLCRQSSCGNFCLLTT